MDKFFYLQRCIFLAQKGGNRVFPNPQVGSVIVHDGQIIGEGFHKAYGGPHAEVEAVRSVKDKHLLPSSTIYVSLEPCNHHGKTPPCTELILEHKIPKVVVGCLDPNPRVAGKGIERLKKAGVEVELSENPKLFEKINAPFFINQREKRPYIVLKWAESADGFIAAKGENGQLQPTPITGKEAKAWVHKLRARHHGIMVGRNTAAIDNPRLNTRNYFGADPIRIVLDRSLGLPSDLNLFMDGGKTIVLNGQKNEKRGEVQWMKYNQWGDLNDLMSFLYREAGICSIIVEGGTNLLQQFLDQGVYDEVYCLKGARVVGSGLKGPSLTERLTLYQYGNLSEDFIYTNFPIHS